MTWTMMTAKKSLFRNWLIATLGWMTILTAIVTFLTNVTVRVQINQQLPQAQVKLGEIMQRKVEIGEVQWIAPTGILGLHPFAKLNSIRLGPAPLEKSEAQVDTAYLSVNVVRSLAQRKFVTQVLFSQANVLLVQAPNYSWFGHPDDTVPSCRSFIPGLQGKQKQTQYQNQNAYPDRQKDQFVPAAQSRITPNRDIKSQNGLYSNKSVDRLNNQVESLQDDLNQRQETSFEQQPYQQGANSDAQKQASYESFDNTQLNQQTEVVEKLQGSYGEAAASQEKEVGLGSQYDFDYDARNPQVQVLQQSSQSVYDRTTYPRKKRRLKKVRKMRRLRRVQTGFVTLGVENIKSVVQENFPSQSQQEQQVQSPSEVVRWNVTNNVNLHEKFDSVNYKNKEEQNRSESMPKIQQQDQSQGELQQQQQSRQQGEEEGPPTQSLMTIQSPDFGLSVTNSAQKQAQTLQEESPSSESDVQTVQSSQQSQQQHSLTFKRARVKGHPPQNPPYGSVTISNQQNKVKQDEQDQPSSWQDSLASFAVNRLALGSITVEQSDLWAKINGEKVPRHLTNVNGTVTFGSNFSSLDVDVTADGYERPSANAKCTMPSPAAKRHLRLSTPGADQLPVVDAPVTTEGVGNPFLFGDGVGAQYARRETYADVQMGQVLGGDMEGVLGDVGEIVEGEMGMSPTVFGNVREKEAVETEGQGQQQANSQEVHISQLQQDMRSVGRPTGGNVRVKIHVKHMTAPGGVKERWPDLTVSIRGNDIHAPLIERIVELPIDIYSGRLKGEFKIRAHDNRTWIFPDFFGRVQCKNASFHFWDAPDDFTGSDMDLLFEGERMYLHGAKGHFGAIQMTASGDLDLNPETGQYRISANVTPVELNALRATLGVRPMPYAASGAVRGVLHCFGPLEQPVFSGTAVAVRPNAQQFKASPSTVAKSALENCPGAVGSYDRVPFQSAWLVFSLDTGQNIFTIHNAFVEPTGGGAVRASGRMDVAPEAELSPEAVKIAAEAKGVDLQKIGALYTNEDVAAKFLSELGLCNAKGTMQGSHMEPVIEFRWELPERRADGRARFTRAQTNINCNAPEADVKAELFMIPASFDQIRSAVTQEAASKLSKPNIEGYDVDLSLHGIDVLPLLQEDLVQKLGPAGGGPPARFKITGQTKFKGKIKPDDVVDFDAQSDSQHAQQRHESRPPFNLQGTLELINLRANQMSLGKQLKGTVSFNNEGILIDCKGPNEDLRVKQILPFGVYEEAQEDEQGGSFRLRQGDMVVKGGVTKSTSRAEVKIQNLKLDELEMSSVRGTVKELSVDLDLKECQGNGKVTVEGPRYSGLYGKLLDGEFKWEKATVKVNSVFEQNNSKYEIHGERDISPAVTLPKSIMELISQQPSPPLPTQPPLPSPPDPRWHINIQIPNAELQDILPIAPLLSDATSVVPIDHVAAKNQFMESIKQHPHNSALLQDQLSALENQPQIQQQSEQQSISQSQQKGSVPGLQELRGVWSGTFNADGGGGAATDLKFNLKGQNWQWGNYLLNHAVASGTYHGVDGLKLNEFSLETEGALLKVQGNLLGQQQDASLILDKFPVAMLQPVYRALPALKNMAPAISVGGTRSPMYVIQQRINRAAESLGIPFGSTAQAYYSDSPLDGKLFVRGQLGGSNQRPEGELHVVLEDGAIGGTLLGEATAKAQLKGDDQQILDFRMFLKPLESRGAADLQGQLSLAASQDTAPLDVKIAIDDGGMAFISTMHPDVRWQGGSAHIKGRVYGNLSDPKFEGNAKISRGNIFCPWLKNPISNLSALIDMNGREVNVNSVDAKVGRRGHIHVQGRMPLTKKDETGVMSVSLNQLELRVPNYYTGQMDSKIDIKGNVSKPTIKGNVKLSKGIVQAKGLQQLMAEGDELSPEEAAQMKDVTLEGLRFMMGPDTRLFSPGLCNVSFNGDLDIRGPIDPSKLGVVGEIRLTVGTANLVGASWSINRDHINKITFLPKTPLDAQLDIQALTSLPQQRGQLLRANVRGKASDLSKTEKQQQNITFARMTADGSWETLEWWEGAEEVIQRMEQIMSPDKLLTNLVDSTVKTLMPQYETEWQIGKYRCRLVSAPSVPLHLWSLESRVDLQNLLASLTSGTEIEIQQNNLHLIIARKELDAQVSTCWSLIYHLNKQLRINFTMTASSQQPKMLLIQYTGEGVPRKV